MGSANHESSPETVIATGVQPAHSEESHLFSERAANVNSLTSEQAFMHMVKGKNWYVGTLVLIVSGF